MLALIAMATFLATCVGGIFALALKDRLHLVLGFSAGAVIGVAFFDLIPEAISLGQQYFSLSTILAFTVLGYMSYLLLDRFVLLHGHGEDAHDHDHGHSGRAGAGTLSIHSFLDGLAIGLAFHVSSAVGIVVAVAVIAHDISDGINTVSMILRAKGSRSEAYKWLFLDAIAPVLGIGASFVLAIPDSALSLLLAIFAGFFLYIGSTDLIPESYHAHSVKWTTFATLLGAASLFIIIQYAQI